MSLFFRWLNWKFIEVYGGQMPINWMDIVIVIVCVCAVHVCLFVHVFFGLVCLSMGHFATPTKHLWNIPYLVKTIYKYTCPFGLFFLLVRLNTNDGCEHTHTHTCSDQKSLERKREREKQQQKNCTTLIHFTAKE